MIFTIDRKGAVRIGIASLLAAALLAAGFYFYSFVQSSSASEYSETVGAGILLSQPAAASFDSTINTSYNSSKTITFAFVPTWNDTLAPLVANATLWGNFSGVGTSAAWAANSTNTSALQNGTANYITINVNATGAYNWTVVFNVSSTSNFTAGYNWTYIIEQGAPYVGNVSNQINATTLMAQTRGSENATNQVMYAPGATYMFNVTAFDANYSISNVLLNFSYAPTNYTATRIGSTNNYSVVITDLNVSTYTYKWFANDSAGNWNVSTPYKFNVTQNKTAPLSVLLNDELNKNVTATYPEAINATILAQGIYTANMWLNGTTNITGLSGAANINIGVGVWNITVNTTSTINYTANATGMTYNITVSKGLSNVTLSMGSGTGTAANATIVQGNTLNLTASVDTAYNVTLELNATLTSGWTDFQSNVTSMTSTSNSTSYTAASNYNITANFAGDLNYTGDTQTWWLNVSARPATVTTSVAGSMSAIVASSTDKITKSFTSIGAGAVKTINEVDLIPVKTGLTEVQLTVKERVTSVEMTVESLSSKPAAASTPAPTVYKYVSISFSNVAETNVQSAKVKFKVEKSWLTQNSLDASKVALYRYKDGAWGKLSTAKSSEDTIYAYYEAVTPGFSYFAIGGEGVAVTTIAPSGQPTTTTGPATTATTMPGGAEIPSDWAMAIVALVVVAVIVVAARKFKLIEF